MRLKMDRRKLAGKLQYKYYKIEYWKFTVTDIKIRLKIVEN